MIYFTQYYEQNNSDFVEEEIIFNCVKHNKVVFLCKMLSGISDYPSIISKLHIQDKIQFYVYNLHGGKLFTQNPTFSSVDHDNLYFLRFIDYKNDQLYKNIIFILPFNSYPCNYQNMVIHFKPDFNSESIIHYSSMYIETINKEHRAILRDKLINSLSSFFSKSIIRNMIVFQYILNNQVKVYFTINDIIPVSTKKIKANSLKIESALINVLRFSIPCFISSNANKIKDKMLEQIDQELENYDFRNFNILEKQIHINITTSFSIYKGSKPYILKRLLKFKIRPSLERMLMNIYIEEHSKNFIKMKSMNLKVSEFNNKEEKLSEPSSSLHNVIDIFKEREYNIENIQSLFDNFIYNKFNSCQNMFV